MQKLVWQNSNGDEINLTSGNYGITNWEGFSNTSLNIQSQQTPFQDGSVYLDGLLEQRELSVTLAMQDNGDLQLRYQQRRELIHILNPKLGEGYLIYTNDFTSKRIKCIPEVPIFENHNSNDSGTPKASLTWVACEPYWENLEQSSVSVLLGGTFKIKNEGDVAISPTDIYVWGEGANICVKNVTNQTQFKISGTVKNIDASLGVGKKDVKLVSQSISFLEGGKIVETDYAQYILARNCILKTSDFKTVKNIKQFTNVNDITSDGTNVYVCGSTFIGMINENGDYVERSDINASVIFYSKSTQKIFYSSSSNGVYTLDDFDAEPTFVKDTEVLYFADINDEVFGCGLEGLLVNFTQDEIIATNAGTKTLRCVAPYKDSYAVIGASGFAQYKTNSSWSNIPLNTDVTLNEFCYNTYTDSYYFGGYGGFLAEIKSDNSKVVIDTDTEGTISYLFFSKLFETVQVCIDSGIAQIKNETELEIISRNNISLTCCKYIDFLGKYIAGSQDSIYSSSDFEVWEQVFYESGIGVFTHIESDDTHVVLGIEDSNSLYESSDGITFTKKQEIIEKLWVTYNTTAEKFFFIGAFGEEYWICSADDVLSNDITKVYQIDVSDWYRNDTFSVSNGSTSIFIVGQTDSGSSTYPALYYTTDGGETWEVKTSDRIELTKTPNNSFLSTRVVDNKILIIINNASDSTLPYFVMWDSEQEDFIVPTFVTDEDYLGFEYNFVYESPYICGYIRDSGNRCISQLSVEGTTVTITKKIEGLAENINFYTSAFDVGEQFVYSYVDSNGTHYAYYNDTAHEASMLFKLRGYIAIVEGNYINICDNNFNVITRIDWDYLDGYAYTLPNTLSVVTSDGEEDWGIISENWNLTKAQASMGDIICLFNYNEKIYIADDNFIYDEDNEIIWESGNVQIQDCKIQNEKLYISLTNHYIKVLNKSFTVEQTIITKLSYPSFEKIYPLANGDVVGFAVDGNTKSIYRYDLNSQETKKIYELTDQSTTFYDFGYFDKLNEVLLITNCGFLGIIDNYVEELLNPQYLTYDFVKNQQPRFVGVWGFRGTIGFTEGDSVINQVRDITLKLDVGENNLVFGYEGGSTMMMNLIYNPKYIGV